MTVANKIRKEFFRLLKKNFPPSNSLLNRTTIKLNCNTMPNGASLINKSNIKKNLEIINVLSPLNVTELIKLFAPTRGSVNLSV